MRPLGKRATQVYLQNLGVLKPVRNTARCHASLNTRQSSRSHGPIKRLRTIYDALGDMIFSAVSHVDFSCPPASIKRKDGFAVAERKIELSRRKRDSLFFCQPLRRDGEGVFRRAGLKE